LWLLTGILWLLTGILWLLTGILWLLTGILWLLTGILWLLESKKLYIMRRTEDVKGLKVFKRNKNNKTRVHPR